MNLKFMRWVDYWIGIPITIILSPLAWLLNFRDLKLSKPSSGKKNKILFIELSEMGSAILADPAMQRASDFGELYFVIFKKNAVSLELFQTVAAENIFHIRDSSLFIFAWDTLRFILWSLKTQFDVSVDLELFSRVTAILSILSFAKLRVGFHKLRAEGLFRGWLINVPVAYNAHHHISENFLALIRGLENQMSFDPRNRSEGALIKESFVMDNEVSDPYIRVPSMKTPIVSPSRFLKVDQLIAQHFPGLTGPLILINPNAGDLLPQRRWPLENFVELIQNLLNWKKEILVGLTGSPSEVINADFICSHLNSSRVQSFAGQTEFKDLPALYQRARLMVTNDSGPGHFAAASGLFTVILFGPETPALYSPLGNVMALTSNLFCSPCVTAYNHRDTPCTNNVCMQTLSPQFVFKRIQNCKLAI